MSRLICMVFGTQQRFVPTTDAFEKHVFKVCKKLYKSIKEV